MSRAASITFGRADGELMSEAQEAAATSATNAAAAPAAPGATAPGLGCLTKVRVV